MTISQTPISWQQACEEVAQVSNLLFVRNEDVLDIGRLQEAVYRLVRGCVAATMCHGTVSRTRGHDVSRGPITVYADELGCEVLDPESVERKAGQVLMAMAGQCGELVDECRVPLGRVGESRYHGSRAARFLQVVAEAVERTQVGELDPAPGWKYVSEMASRVEDVTFKILNENVTELHLLSHNDLKRAGWKNPVEARSLKEQKIAKRRAYREAQGWSEDEYPDEREHPYLK